MKKPRDTYKAYSEEGILRREKDRGLDLTVCLARKGTTNYAETEDSQSRQPGPSTSVAVGIGGLVSLGPDVYAGVPVCCVQGACCRLGGSRYIR